jgi:hypothetical protein
MDANESPRINMLIPYVNIISANKMILSMSAEC